MQRTITAIALTGAFVIAALLPLENARAGGTSFSINIGSGYGYGYGHGYKQRRYGQGNRYGRGTIRYKLNRPRNARRYYNRDRYYSNNYKQRGYATRRHYSRQNAGRGCHQVSKHGYDGYGNKAKIGGTMCYDGYGRPYVVKGSRYIIHSYR